MIMASAQPLRDMWEVTAEARGVLLTEFIALANHRESVQAEITDFGHRFRRAQIEIMEQILGKKKLDEFPWSPAFAAMLFNSLARSMAVEEGFDIVEGHDEVQAMIESMIKKYDKKP